MKVWAEKSSYASKNEGVWEAILEEVAAIGSLAEAKAWREDFVLNRLRNFPGPFQPPLWDLLATREDELRTEAMNRHLDNQFLSAMARDGE